MLEGVSKKSVIECRRGCERVCHNRYHKVQWLTPLVSAAAAAPASSLAREAEGILTVLDGPKYAPAG